MTDKSPFRAVPQAQWLVENRSAFAIADASPVTEGHTLVVPFRQIATWWEASADEQRDLFALVDAVKELLDGLYAPDGYNVGFNAGAAAGQTVSHLHLHVIPRYRGDVTDPRGGIRHVIPDKGNYLAPSTGWPGQFHAPELFDASKQEGRLRLELLRCLSAEAFDRVNLVVSFIMRSGAGIVMPRLGTAVQRGAIIRILTTDYLNITDPDALADLLDLQESSTDPLVAGSMQVRIWHDGHGISFHPKAYMFSSSNGPEARAFVGSSNLSRSGIDGGVEWNLSVRHVDDLLRGFDSLWGDERARPLTHAVLRAYREHRQSTPAHEPPTVIEEIEPPRQGVNATTSQREALTALEQTRIDGYRAGLVVMATGLGKTWLAAFDSSRPAIRRTLFIAHREEILSQARDVFRLVRPASQLGLYYGKEKVKDADVVFASVQTMHNRLDEFTPEDFDYVVVDEFHHASARTYRKIIEHFQPDFLLGLTATPDRMDGADLLALCADNLVYRCDLVEGISRRELVPFHYWGLKDVADYAPIPWRNGKFDPQELAAAIETKARAEQTVEAWREHSRGPTLAFCCSVSHADFMAGWFNAAGISAVAVHSGASSAPRQESITGLRDRSIEVVFAVDMFNEGLDVPEIRTVLMLRPTESPVIFLQQLGRGLRRDEGKEQLRVVDFIGNHHSFLAKPRALLSLGGRLTPTNTQVVAAAESGEFGLPAGCSVAYDLEAVDLLSAMAKKAPRDALAEYCLEYADDYGVRPTAVQAFRSGANPSSARRKHGYWFGLLHNLALLAAPEVAVEDELSETLRSFETEPITKSYKLVALQALVRLGGLSEGARIDDVIALSHALVVSDPRLIADVQGNDIPDVANVDAAEWSQFWRKWPIDHLANDKPGALFRIIDDRITPTVGVPRHLADAFDAMVSELIDWRLAQYLLQERVAKVDARCRVMDVEGRPGIALDRKRRPNLPEGWVDVLADGTWLRARFAKAAISVAERPDEKGNALPDLLRSWFGPSVGLPGVSDSVIVEETVAGWELRPVSSAQHIGGNVIPLFPTYEVACGAFDDPQLVTEASAIRLLDGPQTPPSDAAANFVAFAAGDSMDGGPDPIGHGDPLLFAWARDVGRNDFEGERVLVQQRIEGAHAAVLKRLRRRGGNWVLESDGLGVPAVQGTTAMRVTAKLVQRLDQRSVNPLAGHIGEIFRRDQVPELFGTEFNFGKWGQSGHISHETNEILFVTLNKAGMSTGAEYVDHFDGSNRFIWSSQKATPPESPRGRSVLDSPANRRQVHLWARQVAKEPFTYCGLLIPVSHRGSKPMSVTFRVMTPLTSDMQRHLGIEIPHPHVPAPIPSRASRG